MSGIGPMPAPASEQRDAQGCLIAVSFESVMAHREEPENDCLVAVDVRGLEVSQALLQGSVSYGLNHLSRVPLLVARQTSSLAGRLPSAEQAAGAIPGKSNARTDTP